MKPVHVLAIDANADRCEGYRTYLHQLQCEVMCAPTGNKALELLQHTIPAIIILHVQLPDIDGFELSIAIKGHPDLCDIPLLFVSDVEDEESKTRAYSIGAVECFEEPFHVEELLARFKTLIRIVELERDREAYIAELKNREEKLDRLNREKDEALRIVSHDIRSPLSGILGLSGLMLESDLSKEDQMEWVEMIKNSAGQLLSLVNDLLEFSKIEDGALEISLETVDLRNMIDEGLEMYKMMAIAKKIELIVSVPDEQVMALADKTKLMYALGNLVSNAIKFSNPGQRVWVSLKTEHEGFYVIQVKDEGIGVPAEMLGKLFDRYGSKRRFGTSGEKGTGLGLPISKRFIEAHDGTIDVHSEEGKGTTFSIKIPLKQEVVIN